MKKGLFVVLLLSICASFLVSSALAKNGQESEIENEVETHNAASTKVMPPTGAGLFDSKMRELELKKRELKVNSTTGNTSEATKNLENTIKQTRQEFQQKMLEAKKQRVACLQGRAQDLRALEQERKASVSGMTSACTPKAVTVTIERPAKPTLEGLSTEEKQAVMKEYQQATKDFYTQVQAALKDCKAKIQTTQHDFRERILSIKEQCSDTERTVLGLSTEIPYNAEPSTFQE